MALPQELVDAIVEEVGDDHTLKTCSLVAKSFVVPCQRSLFKTLFLYTSVNLAHHASSTCGHACTLFSASPHLATYVRSLTLCLDKAEHYTSVERVLKMMPLISQLAIHGSTDTFRWDFMTPSLVSSILHAVQLPPLRSLQLKRIVGVPSSLMFYAGSAFRVFSVERVEILQETKPGDAASMLPTQILIPPNRLEELVIPAAFRSEAVCTFVLDLNTQGSLHCLRRVVWRIYGSPCQYWDRLLQEATFLSNLEYIELWFTLQFPRIELPSFRALRTLELKCRMANPSIPGTIKSIVAKLPETAPNLESLIISLRISGRGLLPYPPAWSQDIRPLAPFDTVHYGRQLPRLRQIHCCLKNTTWNLHDSFGPYMQKKFPGPQETCILTCEALH
ncbi:hypothetical protein B0H19DRAFT_1316551 [Mycena capillaripes]|nr:hypothetical protein B0H19DRAFT_1316551 [Mycena capillaripes]